MFKYTYTRNLIDGRYNICNPNRVELIDDSYEQIDISTEISNNLNLNCTIVCFQGLCEVRFLNELTEAEKNQLDIIIENHKNNN